MDRRFNHAFRAEHPAGLRALLPAQQMEKILATLTRAVCDEEHAREIGWKRTGLSVAWVDTTCLKACIISDGLGSVEGCGSHAGQMHPDDPPPGLNDGFPSRRTFCGRSTRCRWG